MSTIRQQGWLNINIQYADLLSSILQQPGYHEDRTGVGTLRTFGAVLVADLQQGFPVIGLRKVPWKSAIAEMVGFVNAFNTAKQFEDIGCKFWRANAQAWIAHDEDTDPGYLGRVYGVQAREWMGDGYALDQLGSVLKELGENPNSRRLLVTHWRPDEFNNMALPPCHVQYQFMADPVRRELHLKFDMRSTDLVLGAPNNLVGYAWLLFVVAEGFGYTPRKLIMTMGDAHIYRNHVDGVMDMFKQTAPLLPTMAILPAAGRPEPGEELEWIESLRPNHFELRGYEHGPVMKFDMAV